MLCLRNQDIIVSQRLIENLILAGWRAAKRKLVRFICCYIYIYISDNRIMISTPQTRVRTCQWSSMSLQWRHNEHDGVSNHQPHGCLLIRLYKCRSKKTSKLRVTGLCVGNSPGTGEFPAQMASNAENVSIWWRHHGLCRGIILIGVWQGASRQGAWLWRRTYM